MKPTLKQSNPLAAQYLNELRVSVDYYKKQIDGLNTKLQLLSKLYEEERNVSDSLAKQLKDAQVAAIAEAAEVDRLKAKYEPKKMTEAEYINICANRLREARDKRLEVEQVYKDKGICPECQGEGEQGGQFTGGTWQCETCNGTGKYP